MKFRQSPRGFTVVELMITIAVVAILIGLVVPSFRDMVVTNRTVARTNDVVSALTRTRSEAVKRGMPAVLCASTDGSSCAGGWSDGWIAYVDADGDGTPDPTEIFLVDSGADVAISTDGGVSTITFTPRGGTAGGEMFRLCGADSSGSRDDRSVELARTGRAAATTETSCP